MEIDRLELDLKTQEGKIEKLNIQLNTVKTNKEYSTLQHEIAVHKADASHIEDQMLALMDEMDGFEAGRDDRRSELAARETRLREMEEHAKSESAAIDTKADALRRERAERLTGISDETKLIYERLMATRDGRAMVRATRLTGDMRSCSGCYMRLTSNSTSILMSGEILVRCNSCGRILYIDDDEN